MPLEYIAEQVPVVLELTCAAVPSLKDEFTAGSAFALKCNEDTASGGRPLASHNWRACISGSEAAIVFVALECK